MKETLTFNFKIYIAGHLGLASCAIWKTLQRKGHDNLFGRVIEEAEKNFDEFIETYGAKYYETTECLEKYQNRKEPL